MTSTPSGYFTASYDSTTRLVSGCVCAILVAVAWGVGSAVVTGLAAATLLAAYAWSPRGYSIAGNCVYVHRLIGRARIPLDAVREVRRAAPDDFLGCIRLFGSGAMFGYYGLFRTTKLGKSHWYLTNRGNVVVIAGAAATSLVSPDEPERFLAAIRATVPVPVVAPSPSFHAAPAAVRASGSAVKIITVALLLLVAFIAIFVPLYSPGPPGYTLSAKSLVIHDRFYPVKLSPQSVDVVRVRVIDLDADRDWRPVARTNGFANSHYRSGHFRAAGGQDIRLYQANSRRLVLLPALGAGATVLLETRDPDGFASELRREWSGPLLSNPPRQ